VRTKNDYINFVKAFNNRMNVYTTVYDFEVFAETAAIDETVILDRIFLDFDAHDDETLDLAFKEVKVVMQKVIEEDLLHTLFFSGRGFHLFIEGERTDDIRNVQAYFKEVKEYLNSRGFGKTLDDRVGQATRLRRVPNTVNMASDDGEGNPYYCIPMCLDDLSLTLRELLDIAKGPRLLPYEKTGKRRAVFPVQPPIEAVEGEVSVPNYEGKLPILPCLHNATMVENPGHYARVYLVQWYRDLLTGCAPKGILGREKKEEIAEIIMQELSNVFKDSQDIWLDWNENETRKHVRYIVNGDYKAPRCTTLISNGFCVGKCWRYANGEK